MQERNPDRMKSIHVVWFYKRLKEKLSERKKTFQKLFFSFLHNNLNVFWRIYAELLNK